MTTCIGSSVTLSSGSIVKFNNLRTQSCIDSLSSFRSSGKFTIEYEGLYLISTWIMSQTNHGQFSVYRNGNSIANAFVMYGRDSKDGSTATIVVTVELSVGDTIWVQTKQTMYLGIEGSCLTLAKLK